MDDYFALVDIDEKGILLNIAKYAYSLGYKAKREKTKSIGYTFAHNKVKKQILRFVNHNGRPIIKLKFFASTQYSLFFSEAIRTVIEEYDYKYTGCYGCGKCDGTQGYHFKYSDGREYFRCGIELIEITDIKNIPLEEFLDLFKAQHDFYSPKL